MFERKHWVCPTRYFLFNGTLEDNITMFAKSPDKTLIESVIQISESKMFISKLKDGLNTNVGERVKSFQVVKDKESH